MKNKITFLFLLIFSFSLYSQTVPQTDLDRALKFGEILVNGLNVIKGNNKEAKEQIDSKTVSSLCFKNKLSEKLSIKLQGIFSKSNDKEETELIKKELVIQPDSKECLYEAQKGVWDYEFIKSSNNEVYKKGQFKLEEEMTIIAKE